MKTFIAGLALALAIGGAASAAGRLDGRWIAQSGNVEVEIGPCGRLLCGTVVRVMANNSMESLAVSKAPPARIGLKIMSDLAPAGDGQWSGKLFDRENGNTYDCLVTPQGRTMTVRAFIWLPLFGKTQTWTRAQN
jgi:uncharacterized protein (DUF2147 family)